MPKTAVLTADAKAAKRKAFRKHLKRYWVLYAMLVLPVAYYIVFKYVPMVGNVLAPRALMFFSVYLRRLSLYILQNSSICRFFISAT